MDQKEPQTQPPGTGGAGGTDRSRVSRRRFLAGAAVTTTVWAAPAVVRLAVALPQAVVSAPPGSRGDRSGGTQVAGRTLQRPDRDDDPGDPALADPGRAVAASGLDRTEGLAATGEDAWKLAGTASVALAAGSWAVLGPHRRPGPPDGGPAAPADEA